jgi:hypothetical protein
MSYDLQIANGENSTFTDIISSVFTAATYEAEQLRGLFTDYSGFLSGAGRVVQVPIMPKINVAAHTDGTTVSATNPAINNVDITTNVFAGRVDITDHFAITSEVAVAQWAGRELARGYMEEFETVLAAAFAGFDSDSALVTGTAAAQAVDLTSGTPDVKALVASARSNLRRGRVFGQYFGVLPTTAFDKLRDQLTSLSSGDITGIGNAVLENGNSMGAADFKPGMIRLFGVNLTDSSVLAVEQASRETGAFFAREAVGYAEKRSPTLEIGRVTGELANRIVLSGMFGAGVVDNRYGYKVRFKTA